VKRVLYTAFFVGLTVQSHAATIRDLTSISTSGVQWDSRIHQHVYYDTLLQLVVQQVITKLIEHPDEFENDLKTLKKEERFRLVEDSGNSRIDLIDLLSVELKLRLQSQWKEHFTIPFHHSELWSLAKYRLKMLIQPTLNLSTGVSFFKAPGMAATQGVLGCALGPFVQIAGHRDPRKVLKVAGISFSPLTFKKGDKILGSCGDRKLRLQRKDSDRSLTKSVTQVPMPTKSSGLLRVVSVLGLNETTSPKMKKGVEGFLKWWRGYKWISERNVELSAEIRSLLNDADVFMPLIDIPNEGNSFIFFGEATRGLRLDFRRPVGDRNIWLSILIPPVEKSGARTGVRFTQEALQSLSQTRQNPLVLIDLACFSNVFMKDWIPALQNAQGNLFIASKRGQRGERISDLLPQIDTLLHAIDQYAIDLNPESLAVALDRGSPLVRRWHEAVSLLDFLKRRVDIPVSFEPVSTLQTPYAELLQAPHRVAIEVQENDRLKIYNPFPEGIFFGD